MICDFQISFQASERKPVLKRHDTEYLLLPYLHAGRCWKVQIPTVKHNLNWVFFFLYVHKSRAGFVGKRMKSLDVGSLIPARCHQWENSFETKE